MADKAYFAAYRAAHREHYRELNARRRRTLREAKICVGCKRVPPLAGRTECDSCREQSRIYQSKSVSGRLSTYRRNARLAGRTFALPKLLFMDLVTDSCFYCGVAPVTLNGIDRVDTSRGYEIDNCVTACWDCNVAKNDKTREEFETWLRRAASHVLEMTA